MNVVSRREGFAKGICQNPLLASSLVCSCELGQCFVDLWKWVDFTENTLI